MKTRHLILLLLKSSGGSVDSKTKFQKLMYFTSLLLEINLGFKPYHYGPYSADLERALDENVGAGFIDVNTIVFGIDTEKGYEAKKFSFNLTKAGAKLADNLSTQYVREYNTIQKLSGDLNSAGNPDYLSLSLAAKAHYILKLSGKPLKIQNIPDMASELGWKISEGEIRKAANLLKNLGFAKESDPT